MTEALMFRGKIQGRCYHVFYEEGEDISATKCGKPYISVWVEGKYTDFTIKIPMLKIKRLIKGMIEEQITETIDGRK